MSFKTLPRLPDPDRALQWNWASAYPAPAKINLFLQVTGRRDDGYHTLQSIFRFIDLTDTLRFVPRSDAQIELANPILGVPPESDLTVRAAKSLQQRAGVRDGVTIHLDKCLPMGGGLGGGSSDAATVLIALNYLWGLGGSRAELQDLALALGADVPVFVFGQSAFATGVGEVLTPVNLSAAWYVLIHPGVHVPTPEIFKAPTLRRNAPEISPEAWESAVPRGVGENDLEPVAVALYPKIGAALTWLKAQPETKGRVCMTGSGACIFAAFDEEAYARQVFARLPVHWQGWVCQGLDRHPLQALTDH